MTSDSSRRRRTLRFVLVLALAAGCVVVARSLWFAAPIHGWSMWPAFEDGEWLLVRRDRWIPDRFDLVVVAPHAADEEPSLKRVVGVGPEWLQVRDGDVFAGVRRAGASVSGLAPACIADMAVELFTLTPPPRPARLAALSGRFALSDDGRYLRLEPGANDPARVRFPARGSLCDRGAAGMGLGREGNVVRDVVVILSFFDLPRGAEVRLDRVCVGSDRAADCSIWWRRREALEVGCVTSSAAVPDRATAPADAVAFRAIVADGRYVVQMQPRPDAPFETLLDGTSPRGAGATGCHLTLAAEGSSVVLSRLDIARDIYYTPARGEAEYGVVEPVAIDDGQIFVLGDNSPASRDSRYWGPLDAARILGRPVAVIWPPRRFRTVEDG